jgi:hypothetical protein
VTSDLKKIWSVGLPEDQRLKVLLQQALDEALRAQIIKLYMVMMTDQSGQPERALKGVAKAVEIWRAGIKSFAEPSS